MNLIDTYLDIYKPVLTIGVFYRVKGRSQIFDGYYAQHDHRYLYFGNMLNQFATHYNERMISPEDIISIEKVM